MDMESLRGKRKKKHPKCANPLFERWLQEWMDEASEKGWKSQYVYSKALKSLRIFPLHLETGKDCKILQNFGDKICKMLDDRLAQHRAAEGTDDEYVFSAANAPLVRTASQKENKKQALESTTTTHPAHYSPMDTMGSITQDSSEENTGPQRKRRKSSSNKRPREYIPALRSGAYAILLTLYRSMQDPDTRGFMTKSEIVREAQPLADKSFSVPDPGCRYTSWSSMGTLIKKGLIIKESSPARYSLSDAGCELAHRLEAVDGDAVPGIPQQPTRVPPLPETNPRLPAIHTMSDSDEGADAPDLPKLKCPHRSGTHNMSDSEGETTPSPLASRLPGLSACNSSNRKGEDDISAASLDKLQYWYVTEDCRLVMRKDEAAVLIDDVISIGFLVKCNYQSLIQSGKSYKLDTTKRLSDDFVYAYLCDKDAAEIARPPKETTESVKKGATKSKPKAKPGNVTHTNKPRMSARDEDEETLPDVTPLSSMPSSRASSVATTASTRSLPPPDFVLHAGTFDVVLCVDNREFYGSNKCQSKTLLPDLIKNGVECDLRELAIGDMLWIARERVQPQPGQLERPKGRELVIDFIVERKRMDDLVSSMVDGRFREQKFRLKRSGIANLIYLIEDYGSLQHFSISEDRITQAIVNTQVIDGFKVKRTGGVKETVAYLTVMTRYLQSFYRNKTLQACTPEILRELDSSFHIDESEKLLTTFQHFNHASVKSKDLTVRELFGKQLVQLHGMSADKAKAVTDKYPTPSSLLSAYDSCITQKEKEILLSNIKAGKGMRMKKNVISDHTLEFEAWEIMQSANLHLPQGEGANKTYIKGLFSLLPQQTSDSIP